MKPKDHQSQIQVLKQRRYSKENLELKGKENKINTVNLRNKSRPIDKKSKTKTMT
jgi:hypothetical protein